MQPAKPISEMTEQERAEGYAQLVAEIDKDRRDAVEADILPMCKPGVIGFMGSGYQGTSDVITDDTRLVAEPWLRRFFDLLPDRQRIDYWWERIEVGATLLTLYFDPATFACTGAGWINCELCDGEPIVFAPVMSYSATAADLHDTALIAESVALRTGAKAVHLWTPLDVALVPGYRLQPCFFGQQQVAPIRPIQ